MKRAVLAATTMLIAQPASAHHPSFTWGFVVEHLTEWDHLAVIVVVLATGAYAYRRWISRRAVARAESNRERRHDPR